MTRRSIKAWLARTSILGGVILCLCFSVGEGLHLRPFPTLQSHESPAALDDAGPVKTQSYKYGPLDVPNRVQTRSKRQVVDYGHPPAQHHFEPNSDPVTPSTKSEPTTSISLFPDSGPIGRAPPVS
jgi:hypothetical protein